MRKYSVFIGLLFAFCLGTFTAQAAEELVSAKDTAAILEMAKGYGSASLTTDNEGDPKVQGKIEGVNYGIYFFGCTNGQDCDSIMFSTGWLKKVKLLTLEDLNVWNQKKRFAHAFLDKDGDTALQMDVNMSHGMTSENLDVNFQRWRSLIRAFQKDVLN